jgi:hypothetical protein
MSQRLTIATQSADDLEEQNVNPPRWITDSSLVCLSNIWLRMTSMVLRFQQDRSQSNVEFAEFLQIGSSARDNYTFASQL